MPRPPNRTVRHRWEAPEGWRVPVVVDIDAAALEYDGFAGCDYRRAPDDGKAFNGLLLAVGQRFEGFGLGAAGIVKTQHHTVGWTVSVDLAIWVTAMRPPSPSFIFGSEVVGVTESRFSDKPVHTLPVFSLIRAAVSPPTTVVVLALMSVLTPVLTVDALMVEAFGRFGQDGVAIMLCDVESWGGGGDAGVGLLVLYVESCGLLVFLAK